MKHLTIIITDEHQEDDTSADYTMWRKWVAWYCGTVDRAVRAVIDNEVERRHVGFVRGRPMTIEFDAALVVNHMFAECHGITGDDAAPADCISEAMLGRLQEALDAIAKDATTSKRYWESTDEEIPAEEVEAAFVRVRKAMENKP